MDMRVISAHELVFADKTYACVVGRGGFSTDKREGDGTTPVGRFALRSLRYRSDRLAAPASPLKTRILKPQDGWCDAPDHPLYNRPVNLPFEASHERLWRDDALYNVIVDLGYNDAPPVAGRGSAIFLHVADAAGRPTEGCVALRQSDLLEILAACDSATCIDISPRSPSP